MKESQKLGLLTKDQKEVLAQAQEAEATVAAQKAVVLGVALDLTSQALVENQADLTSQAQVVQEAADHIDLAEVAQEAADQADLQVDHREVVMKTKLK